MTVDQIMVRKVGGWNMISPAQWRMMDVEEKKELLSQGGVKFFAQGEAVGLKEAILELKPGGGPKPSGPEAKPEPESDEPNPEDVVEITPISFSETIYSRQVVAGPAWLVTREVPGEEAAPLWVACSRDEHAYNLDTYDGQRTLVCDLMADSFGLEGDSMEIFGEPAFKHFDTNYFSTSLGDRFWEVTAQEIRTHMSHSPFINVLNLR